MDLLTPRSPNSALEIHTQKQCTPRGSSWGLPYTCFWPLKAPGSTFGGGSPNLSSAPWCQYRYPLLSININFQCVVSLLAYAHHLRLYHINIHSTRHGTFFLNNLCEPDTTVFCHTLKMFVFEQYSAHREH